MDCGPTCLRMLTEYYGKVIPISTLRSISVFGKQGMTLLDLADSAERIGFRTRGVQLSFEQVIEDAELPCILHWQQYHYVVLLPLSNYRKIRYITIADPAKGIIKYTKEEFKRLWLSSRDDEGIPVGIALLLDPMPKFYEFEDQKENKLGWGVVLQYLGKTRWQITNIFISLLIASLLQLIFPFLTKSIVDTGINTRNLHYITIVLIAQLMLILSRSIVDFIRSRLLLRVSTIVNLSILSDFWIKLTSLPINYFTSHHTGDTLQRIADNRQIQNFLTSNALNTLLSLVTFALYSVLLASYNIELFLIFTIGSILYFCWILLFLRIRRRINYQTFNLSSKENTSTLQLVQGMQEIKLNNAEQQKRWEWEDIQTGIFKLNYKTLTYSQFQEAGALFINQGKDVVITFVVAGLVIDGRLTFGTMLAIQYIIGQLTGPIEQFISFIQSAQDARISMERLNEIHQLKNEESALDNYITQLPYSKDIKLNNVSFSFPGTGSNLVLENINIEIQEGKVTAIVGVSGSGKTTLLKLLLKFYDHYIGEIKIGEANFKFISPSFWRKQCGAVLQDGYIFNDTVARNISVGDETINYSRLVWSCKTANILSFIESLPNGFNTQLGAEGVGISQGQKQRLLIARSIYKSPEYLFFDEATNALDTKNEKTIVENLQGLFNGKTVVIVAHRLSTVKNADKIYVLHEGKIAEEGTHQQLTASKGRYYDLVKDQLELTDS